MIWTPSNHRARYGRLGKLHGMPDYQREYGGYQ